MIFDDFFMKKVILLVILILLALIGFYIVFKPETASKVQGAFLDYTGPSFNNLFKKAGGWIGESIKQKKPEIQKELKKETQELKSEAGKVSNWLWDTIQPVEYVKKIIEKGIRKNDENKDETNNNSNTNNKKNRLDPEESCECP